MSGRYYNSLTIISLTVALIFSIDKYAKSALSFECSQHQLCVNENAVSSNVSKSSSNTLSSNANQSLSYPMVSPLSECSCNSVDCHIYGDCCLDVELDRDRIASLLSITRYSCLSIFTRGVDGIKQTYFYAIAKCSHLWQTQSTSNHNNNDKISFNHYNYYYNNFNEIKSNCEHINANNRDLLLSLPIVSRMTNTTYRNIYCAVCNFDHQNSEVFEANTFCSNKSKNHCSLVFDKPLLNSTKLCNSYNVVDSCNAEPHTEKEMLDCSLYFAPIKPMRKFTLYKNKYCAKCNNISEKQMTCHSKTPKSKVTLNESEFTFSFSVLLDINIRSGAYVGAKQKCEESHIFDPWKKICRRVYCKENSVFESGKCVSLDKNINQSLLNSFEFCPKEIIPPEEYRLLSNGWVYLIPRNKSYNSSQYEIDSTTNVLKLCTDSEDIDDQEYKFHYSHSYLTIACLLVSIISLAIKFFLFLFYDEKPRRLSSILVIFLSLSLICAQLLFLFGINRIEIAIICQLIAILIHYFFLSSFFWMSVLSYDIYRVFSSMLMRHNHNHNQLFIYAAYGWGLPFIIILSAVVVDMIITEDKSSGILAYISPSYGTTYCWIANRLALNVFFASPLAILLIINSALLILTAIKITAVSSESRIARENIHRRNERFRFVLYIKLATIMGSTWVIGFIAAYAENYIIWTLFIVFNSLQGLYILLAFTNLSKLNLLRCCPSGGTSRRTSTKSTSTTSAVVTRL